MDRSISFAGGVLTSNLSLSSSFRFSHPVNSTLRYSTRRRKNARLQCFYECSNCGNDLGDNSKSLINTYCNSCNAKIPSVSGLNQVADLSAPRMNQMKNNQWIVRAPAPVRQELFRSPLVAFLYERGWRNSFNRAGFPGIDEEFELVLEAFEKSKNAKKLETNSNKKYSKKKSNVRFDGVAVDVSCGSGLMARRMYRSGNFTGKVIALDFSESMLRETVRRFDDDLKQGKSRKERESDGKPELEVIRADISRLPLQSNSVRWIHSGAAMHCWPVVQDGLSEIYRVLEPGASAFLTTFLWPNENIKSGAPQDIRFFGKKELEYLCKGAGFEHVNVERKRNCAILRLEKENKD